PYFLTGAYGAPEAWGGDRLPLRPSSPPRPSVSPAKADIYSFGCLAYEILTAEVLFDGPTPAAMRDAHTNHDGAPPRIAALAKRAPEAADFLRKCLRQDATRRPTAAELRRDLARIEPRLKRRAWPL